MTPHEIGGLLIGIFSTTGISHRGWQHVVMWGVSFFFLYLAIVKNLEPLLLLPIGFGIFIVTFPLLAVLLITGGILIRDFALALTIGVAVETYSSVFVASPIVYIWPVRRKQLRGVMSPKAKPVLSPIPIVKGAN